MIRLPDATALGPTPSGNSGRPIATIDQSAIGRGAEQLGAGLQRAGGEAMAYAATHQDEADKQRAWDAATKWNDIQNQQKLVAQGMSDQMQPGGVGTLDAFEKQYKAATDGFYKTLPPHLAGQYRAQIHDYAGTLTTVLNGAVLKEKGRFAGVQQDTMNNQFINNADPNDPKAAADKIDAYTRANPNLSPIDKETRIANTPNTVAVGIGNQILGSKDTMRPIFRPGATTPDDVWSNMLHKENATGDPSAVSSKGAQGVAQVMPDTAREVAGKLGMADVAKMNDAQLHAYFADHPEVNHEIGRAYFDHQLAAYNGDTAAAVVAYNGGPGVADKWLKSGRDDSVLPSETRDYKNTVLNGGSQQSAPVPEEEAPDDFPDASSTVPNSTTPSTIGLSRYLVTGRGAESVTKMQPPLQTGLSAMFAAAPPEVQPYLKIFSGYRSPERQAQLWDAALKKYGSPEAARKWVAPPGNSQHNKGNAADLAFDGAGTTAKLSANGQAAMQWAHANAGKFGLAFPLSNEPWHVEAAGARGGNATSPTPQDPYAQARSYFQGKFGDTVDPGILNQLANAAVSKWNASNQETRANISQALSDAPSAIANTGQYTGYRPTQQDFSDAYGHEGDQRYSEFQQSLQVAQTTHNISTLPQEQVQAQVAQARANVQATTGQGAEQAAKDYDAVAKAAAASLKARNDDAAGYVQQAFPAVQSKWAAYQQSRTPENMAAAITATQAAQEQLNIPVQNRNVLPSNVVDDFIARQKQPDRTVDQNMQELAGTVFATNDPAQQEAIFNQLKKAGVPSETETVLRAYSRGDKASASFLAAVIAAKNIPEKKDPTAADTIPNAVDVAMGDPNTGVAQTLYGLDIGQDGNLETYTNDRNVFIKAVKVKMMESSMTQDAAIKSVNSALYGDAKVLDQGNAKIVITGSQDGDSIVKGLSHQMDSVRAALTANGEASTAGAKPEDQNSNLIVKKLADFKVNDVINSGTWRNLGQGFGFVDNATGLFVAGKDGKPLIITPDRAQADGRLYSSVEETVKQNKQDVKPVQTYMDQLQKKKDEAVRAAPAFRPSPAIAPLSPGLAPAAPDTSAEPDPTVAPGQPAPSDVLPGTPAGDGWGGSGVGM